ncbi:hypothetical protein FACS1894187_10940 [Synergistales bacterium]|nr:hypothetical protein FACS1894187_10940 [Synergistales bacterium]
MIILAIVAAFLIHEGGHWVAAFCFGERLRFRFAWGRLDRIPVPRYVWKMPYLARWKQRVIALSGFGAEMLAALSFWVIVDAFLKYYAAVALAHFIAYRFYAGEDSDFRWIGNRDSQ